MAENKKSFILYADMIHTVRKMSKQKAGELFITILSYVNDENPVVTDTIIELVFEPIKQQLKRHLKDWEKIKTERSTSGRLGNLKRWNKDLYNRVVADEISLEEAEKIAKDRYATIAIAKVANVAVNDNVIVNVNDINNNMWLSIKKIFLTDGPWQFKFVTEKKISLENLEKKQTEFLIELDLKEDFKDLKDLKNHFTNWFNKNKNTAQAGPAQNGLPHNIKTLNNSN